MQAHKTTTNSCFNNLSETRINSCLHLSKMRTSIVINKYFNLIINTTFKYGFVPALVFLQMFCHLNKANGQKVDATLHIDLSQKLHKISPNLYGAFFEEISHGGDGGLYAEMLQNRGFEDAQIPAGCTYEDGYIVPNRTPHFGMRDGAVSDWKLPYPAKGEFPGWLLQQPFGSAIQIRLSTNNPLSAGSAHNMEIQISKLNGVSPTSLPGIINNGYHGIYLQKGASYNLSFYACTKLNGESIGNQLSDLHYAGKITACLFSQDSQLVAKKEIQINPETNGWQSYNCNLFSDQTVNNGYFALLFDNPGHLLLDFVSLFPRDTYKNIPGGLRKDLAQKIADLHPAFLRWPGGCYVEGMNIESAFDWKNTIGPLINRPQTFSPWGYWSTNGFGYDEYLRFCEQIGAKGLFVANVGVSCEMRSGTFAPDDSLQHYIQNVLDAIEYAIGSTTSRWGSLRAKNGHPAAYPLEYVEIGNEQAGPRYAKRYNLFYKAIHKEYPNIQIIASMGLGDMNHYTTDSMQHLDIADEHAYKAINWSMSHYDHFDQYPRKGYQIYVGEFATNSGVGKGNMGAALSDAVYMMGMEKNGDLITMSSYAPLLADVHDDNWPVNLINFNGGNSFARISYYALQLFEQNRPSYNLKTELNLTPEFVSKSNSASKSLFKGSIGFATWDTQTEYKDLVIKDKNQHILYQSDFKNRPTEWNLLRGQWDISDSSLSETAQGPQTLAFLKNHSFDTYTLDVKARKLSGTNAFIIPFGIKDSNSFYRAHIGSWVNSHATIEKVTNGYDVADLITQQPLSDPIKAGQWYNIQLKVMPDSISCYLDGKLLMTYQEPKKMFALAGKDNASGDLIIKLVNADASIKTVQLELSGIKRLPKSARLTTLSAPDLDAENSLNQPTEFIPHSKIIDIKSSNPIISIPACSINIIRIQNIP